MLAYFLDNKPFALEVNSSIQLTFKNPAINTSSFPGDIGLGIRIPVNDINQALLGNPERFDKHKSQETRKFPNFRVVFHRSTFMMGDLIIYDADDEFYNGWLRSDTGNIGEEHREKEISESFSFNQEKIFENKVNYNPDFDDYGCPEVYNPHFFKEKGEKTNVIISKPNPNYGKYVWRWIGYEKDLRQFLHEEKEVEDLTHAFKLHGLYTVNKKQENGLVKAPITDSRAEPHLLVKELEVCVVSPMLFLNKAIHLLFKDSEFGIRNNFLADDPDLKKLVIYNNYDITQIIHYTEETDLTYRPFTPEADPLTDTFGEVRSSGYYINKILRWPRLFYYKDLLPKIKLKDFILGVQNTLNIFHHFIPGRKLIDIIDREKIFEENAIDISRFLLGNWKMETQKNTSLEFSFQHDKNDMLFSEYWKNINDYRDLEKEPVETHDDLLLIEDPEMDEVRLVKGNNVYMQYKLWLNEWDDPETGEHHSEKYLGWDVLTIGFQNSIFNYGQNETETIHTKFSTLRGHPTAKTLQKGNISSELFAFETFSPRLLFYNGNNTGSYKSGNISLDWEEEISGLLQSRWKNWSRFLATRQPASVKAFLPLGMLIYMIHNIYKKYRGKEGEFIIDELSFELSMNKISDTTIKAFKINYQPGIISLNDTHSLNDVVWIDQEADFTGLEEFYPLYIG